MIQARQAEAYFDRESDTLTPTVKAARSFLNGHKLGVMQSKCGVRGRTEHHERVKDEREQEPQQREAKGPHERREDVLKSTRGQEP